MTRVLCLLGLCALFALSVSAATIGPGPLDTNPDPNFVFTVDIGLGTLTVGTPSGPDELTVSGLGNLFIGDNGTPGQLILGVNTGFTELIGLTFDTSGATLFDGGNQLLVNAVGSPITTVSDPVLLALLGASTWDFVFAGTGDGQFLFDFSSAVTTPEPAAALPLGLSLAGFAVLGLRRRFR